MKQFTQEQAAEMYEALRTVGLNLRNNRFISSADPQFQSTAMAYIDAALAHADAQPVAQVGRTREEIARDYYIAAGNNETPFPQPVAAPSADVARAVIADMKQPDSDPITLNPLDVAEIADVLGVIL